MDPCRWSKPNPCPKELGQYNCALMMYDVSYTTPLVSTVGYEPGFLATMSSQEVIQR